MKFCPLQDRILVKKMEAENKTAAGIIIPDVAKDKPVRGTVLAVGKGLRASNGDLIPMEVKKGDEIIFNKWSGTEIKLDDHKNDDLIIMKESDVLGTL